MIQKTKKFKKRSSQQTIFFSLVWGLLLFLVIAFLIISNWRINQKRSELNLQIRHLQDEIEILEKRKEELKAGISQVSDQDYLEEVAREKFGLQKPGEEVVVVLPPPEEEKEAKKEEKGILEKILEKLRFW